MQGGRNANSLETQMLLQLFQVIWHISNVSCCNYCGELLLASQATFYVIWIAGAFPLPGHSWSYHIIQKISSGAETALVNAVMRAFLHIFSGGICKA